ncbi:uncharacterized protein [Amphiura filiformis]|uniref:uncharacterized protein n=1 Tax=Amphiura filiformis TaxID=82378 RepID=UPI003B21C22E
MMCILMGQCCICSSDAGLCKDKTEQTQNDDVSVQSQSTPSKPASQPALSISSNSNKDVPESAAPVRPTDLNLNVEDKIIKEEDENSDAEHEMTQLSVGIQTGEDETPLTDCTVISCVSRGASCTPSEIRRVMQIPPMIRPVSSMEFSSATEELLSPTKIHGWGHHHKRISKKLKKRTDDTPKEGGKLKKQVDAPEKEGKHRHKTNHSRSKHRRHGESAIDNNGRRKHGSNSKRKKKSKRARPESKAGPVYLTDIPAYRVPSIAVL